MTYRLLITEQAETDIRGIYEYITFVLCEPGAAALLVRRLKAGIDNLSFMPERFRVYRTHPADGREFRMMPVENYCIFYYVDKSSQTVRIIRVLYGKRDMDSAFPLPN